jgi:hypothetical protein
MNRRAVLAMLFSCLFIAGGCEFKQEIWLNPDGSGKMAYEAVFVPQGNDKASEPAFTKPVSQVIDSSKGIEAWENVEAKLLDDGRIHFKGTAYFPDLRQVKITRGPGAMTTWEDVDGGKRLTLDDKGPDFKTIAYKPGDDLDAAALRARQILGQAKHMQYAVIRDGHWQLKIHLPAPIESTTNFKRAGASTVMLDVKGNDMIAAMEAVINDTDAIKQALKDTAAGKEDAYRDRVHERLFGEAGPVSVTTRGVGKPHFDYAAQVARVKENSIEVYRQLGLMADKLPPMPAELADMKVTLKEVRPMAEGAKRMTIELTADAEVDIVEEEDGRIFEVIGDNGQRLAPSFGVTRTVDTRGRRGNVELTVYLAPPGEDVTKLSVIRGTFIAVIGGESKEHEMGFKTFEVGETDEQFNARITKSEVDMSSGDATTILTIELDLPRGAVDDVRLVDAAGEKIRVYDSDSGTDKTTLKCRISSNGIPEGAKMFIEVYENAKRLEVPFEVRDIDLTAETE